MAADLNYRSKVMPDKARARTINRSIAPHLGFLVGNDTDLADALGYETQVSGSAPFDDWLDAYGATVRQVARDFPNLSLVGTQWRGAKSADAISWGAAHGILVQETPGDITMVDQRAVLAEVQRAGRRGGVKALC